MVVIGGLGSLPGAVLGAVYVRGSELLLRGGWAQIASGAGIMALLLVLPGGLGDLMYRVRDAYLRWVAKRHGIHVPSLVADSRIETDEAPVALDAALGGLVSVSGNGHAKGFTTNGHAAGKPLTTEPLPAPTEETVNQ
jgi:hypothetical protein